MLDNFLEHLPLFTGFTTEQRSRLSPVFEPCDFCTGSALFEQGDTAEYLYLVVSGEVTIRFKPEDGPPIIITRVHQGGVVGWSAALGNLQYTSGAICTAFTQMLRVRGQDLRSLCDRDPGIADILLTRLAAIIAERLRNTHEHVITMLRHGMGATVNEG